MTTISNNQISITVSADGAEMHSLKDINTGREYLWQGDPEFWTGHSPILFPIVGGLWNGTMRVDGREYKTPKHGFVKHRTWKLECQTEDSLTYSYWSTEEDEQLFPRDYALEETYRLEGRKVVNTMKVKNYAKKEMWFQIGGHPGFNLPDYKREEPLSGYMQLHGEPTEIARAGEQGCIEAERHPAPLNADGLVELRKETFDNEALIFENHAITGATLLTLSKEPYIRVESNSQTWLFWSPQGQHAPFLCTEPWFGMPDDIGFEGEIHERSCVIGLPAGKSWEGRYSIEVV